MDQTPSPLDAHAHLLLVRLNSFFIYLMTNPTHAVSVEQMGATTPNEFAKLHDMSTPLANQLVDLLGQYEGVVDPTELKRFSEFSSQYLTSRVARGNELASPKISEALALKEAFHGKADHFFFVTCIDGRNIPTIMFSYVPRLGGFLRTRAGDIFEFEELMNSDEMRIDPETEIYKKIRQLLIDRPGETVYYGLDSHLGCKAREGISTQEGSPRQDKGLRDDINRKLKIAKALKKIREDLVLEGKKVAEVVPDLFSYDPENGTMIVGLEQVMDDPIFASDDFDPHNDIATLAAQGKIIDTWALLQDEEIASALRDTVRPVNFRKDYADGLLTNWHAITDLYDDGNGPIYQKIRGQVDHLYGTNISEEHKDHKTKIILKNLITRWSQAENKGPQVDDEGKLVNPWPFSEHEERTIVISERVFGPFESIEKFVVTPATVAGEQEMLDNATTGLTLVRQFRPESERKMPVLIDSQVIVRSFNNLPPEVRTAAWDIIRGIDFSFLSDIDWDDPAVANWTLHDIGKIWRDHLRDSDISSGRVALIVKDFIWESFSRMRSFLGDRDFRSQIKNGNVIIMNTIVNRDGKPELILPLGPRKKAPTEDVSI